MHIDSQISRSFNDQSIHRRELRMACQITVLARMVDDGKPRGLHIFTEDPAYLSPLQHPSDERPIIIKDVKQALNAFYIRRI